MNNVVRVPVPKWTRIRKRAYGIAKLVFLFVVIMLLYFPIIVIIIQSVNQNAQGTYFSGFTLDWYKQMFQDTNLMIAIRNTISVAVLATVISTILGTFFALGINSLQNKRRRQMIILNNVPVLNADVVTGVSLLFIFKFFGIIVGNEFILGYETMLVAHVFFCIPYVVLSILPKLNEVDKNLYDAAVDLGCTPLGALMKVIIPSIRTGIFTGALLAFTMSFDDFVISYMVAGEEVKNFSMWIYASQRASGRVLAWPKAYAYNAIISLVVLLILIVYNIVLIKKQKRERKVRVNLS